MEAILHSFLYLSSNFIEIHHQSCEEDAVPDEEKLNEKMNVTRGGERPIKRLKGKSNRQEN